MQKIKCSRIGCTNQGKFVPVIVIDCSRIKREPVRAHMSLHVCEEHKSKNREDYLNQSGIDWLFEGVRQQLKLDLDTDASLVSIDFMEITEVSDYVPGKTTLN